MTPLEVPQKNIQYLYQKLKEIYETSTLTNLFLKSGKWFMGLGILYFVLLTGISLGLLYYSQLFFNHVWWLLITLVGSSIIFISIIEFATTALIGNFGNDAKKRIQQYGKNWKGARYSLFKKEIEELHIGIEQIQQCYAFIDNEKVIPSSTIWDHKVSVTYIAVLLLCVGGVVDVLSGGTVKMKALLFVATFLLFLFYPMIYFVLDSVKSSEKQLSEFKRFLEWYECDLYENSKKPVL